MSRVNLEKSVVIFECCRIVKGHTKSVIYDLQRSKNRYIPNDLADILLAYNGKRIDDILANYPSEHHQILLDNVGLLIDEEYLFLTKHPSRFPAMSIEWDEPSKITNAIIEFGAWITKENTLSKLNQVLSLGCQHIEFRIYDKLSFSKFLSTVALVHSVGFLSIDIVAHCPTNFRLEDLRTFVVKHLNLRNIIFFGCKASEKHQPENSEFGTIILTSDILTDRMHCGKINLNHFVDNIKFFTESLHHNSCLNRKISVDTNGNIKNCPSINESFGNIEDTALLEAMEKPDFKKYWGVHKDKIHVCKDCEYRYMCHDCRAYIEDPEDILSKPLKCGYNPYTGEWSEWSTNPLKQKAIDSYGMRDMVEGMNAAEK